MIAFVNNRHNPLPKINRQRLGHARRALSPARRVNHIASGLGILNEIVSFDDALVFDDEDDQCSLKREPCVPAAGIRAQEHQAQGFLG